MIFLFPPFHFTLPPVAFPGVRMTPSLLPLGFPRSIAHSRHAIFTFFFELFAGNPPTAAGHSISHHTADSFPLAPSQPARCADYYLPSGGSRVAKRAFLLSRPPLTQGRLEKEEKKKTTVFAQNNKSVVRKQTEETNGSRFRNKMETHSTRTISPTTID